MTFIWDMWDLDRFSFMIMTLTSKSCNLLILMSFSFEIYIPTWNLFSLFSSWNSEYGKCCFLTLIFLPGVLDFLLYLCNVYINRFMFKIVNKDSGRNMLPWLLRRVTLLCSMFCIFCFWNINCAKPHSVLNL